MRAAETARLHDPSLSRVESRITRGGHPPVAQARARRAEEDGLPSVGVFLLAPALGLCFWVGLALLIF